MPPQLPNVERDSDFAARWPLVGRLSRMDRAEIAWRSRALLRRTRDRIAWSVGPPRWDRRQLPVILSDLAPREARVSGRRAGQSDAQWMKAHRALADHFTTRAPRFLIAPGFRSQIRDRIARAFPSAPQDAAARGDRVVAGFYDLLGFTALRFDSSSPSQGRPAKDAAVATPPPARGSRHERKTIDWHLDPVSGRRAPIASWGSVPYLDPRCGDPKITWELNRHQHWLTLGRALWLTDDRRYRDRFLRELETWMAANPPLTGINWVSMLELGLRSLSWIWSLNFFAEGSESDEQPWTVDLLIGIDRQLSHVERHLSYYFSPNTHLLGEALALYVAGRTLPELSASPRWEDRGRRILVAEITRQINADGGACERSTHYHRYTADFYLCALAIARITRDPIAAVFQGAVLRLATALRHLCDEGARFPHFGDDDGGMLFPLAGRAADDLHDSLAIAAELTGADELAVGQEPEETYWLLSHPVFAQLVTFGHARNDVHEPSPGAATAPESRPKSYRRGPSSIGLVDTGYYVSRSAAGEHLVIDGGPHGFRNGGHAHADALSMTLSVRGRHLLIDPGTACYTADPALRDRFRSTAAHNTVVINGQSQSLPAGPFHWKRVADARVHRWRTAAGFDYLDASHNGYAPLEHRRRVLALHGDMLIAADFVGGAKPESFVAHWHVGPEWKADMHPAHAVTSFRAVTLRTPGETVRLLAPTGTLAAYFGDAGTGLGWHSPRYGRVEPTTTIAVQWDPSAAPWLVSVFDLNALDPIAQVDLVPVWAEASALAHGAAVRILREKWVDYVMFAEPAQAQLAGAWRTAQFETDARMLLCRVAKSGEITRLAIVDGSFVRARSPRALSITLGRVESALDIDAFVLRNCTPCAASPAS